ncbi:iron complex outermembrane receptor protein [Alkalispirillum mobile]|uniref:Iron complex outermembrane receptor protein n=1 Tax=Alkalispirillum mobile TaxID=85925 RepID=A0A498C6T4_9GAMM|nr:TonB-dependent copper receptor [Alkalispirillum mobile]RLK48800.1 iron complex outermembrane receptor protein [Alkalispirillum mobile]
MPASSRTRHATYPISLGLLTGAALLGTPALADAGGSLAPIVVTAPVMTSPGELETDPRTSRLPLPAQDGGSFLKSIPGFTTSRKGGTSGDPELRGLGGGRLNILMDGSPVFGGCGQRMDPPTAYIYPESYDRVRIYKGPQTVRFGPTLAGVVDFERDPRRFDDPTVTGHASMTVGRFDRTDLMADVTAGSTEGYARIIGTLSTQDDYRDGDGDKVHSEFERWSGTGILGWTPDEFTNVEFAYERSDAEAAYGDRMMDGTTFDRTGYSLTARREAITLWLEAVEFKTFYSYVDHVMDNFRLRSAPQQTVSFPDRRTTGAKVDAELVLADQTWMTVGLDYTEDEHRRGRRTTMEGTNTLQEVLSTDYPRNDTAEFRDYGAYAELEHGLTARDHLFFGARVDRNRAEAESPYGGAPPGTTDHNTLWSGFARYERDLADLPLTFNIGVGAAERAPDFWERMKDFDLETERLTQLDAGAQWHGDQVSATVSAFYGEFSNYILIGAESGEADARNISATHYGLEADLTYRFTPVLSSTATLAWVRADNDSDSEPLAQTPPLEGTLSLDYDDGSWFGGGVVRAVERQDRIHEGFGTIYSVDTGETPGFATLGLYAGHRFTPQTHATLGVDNVFDKQYREHIQGGSPDLDPNGRFDPLNEPGRQYWMKVATRF